MIPITKLSVPGGVQGNHVFTVEAAPFVKGSRLCLRDRGESDVLRCVDMPVAISINHVDISHLRIRQNLAAILTSLAISTESLTEKELDMAETRLKVIVAGAGIAGLATAIALRQLPNVDVEIYERSTELKEIGASIALSPNVVLSQLLLVHSTDR